MAVMMQCQVTYTEHRCIRSRVVTMVTEAALPPEASVSLAFSWVGSLCPHSGLGPCSLLGSVLSPVLMG